MNQDSSFPPMLPPSTELGALLFAVLPCLQETYRPLASFAYHMTELTRMKSIPSMPPLTGISGIDALITDKDIMLRSLSFYGRMFRMPLLSTIATLLQGMQFYQAYKDILPGLFSGMGGATQDPASAFGSMAGLFSGLGGLGSASGPGGSTTDLFSMLGGLSPDLLSSVFSGSSSGHAPRNNETSPGSTEDAEQAGEQSLSSDTPSSVNISDDSAHTSDNISNENSPVWSPDVSPEKSDSGSSSAPDAYVTEAGASDSSVPLSQHENTTQDDSLYNTLYSFLTPEQQKIYEQLMHTD